MFAKQSQYNCLTQKFQGTQDYCTCTVFVYQQAGQYKMQTADWVLNAD